MVSVFRNGEHIQTCPVEQIDQDELISLMLGRSIEEMYPQARPQTPTERGLVVRDLCIPGAVSDFSITVPRGKILSIAGQIGSGASMVTRALAGLIHNASGGMAIDGEDLPFGSAARCVARSVIFISEDRAGEGLFRRNVGARQPHRHQDRQCRARRPAQLDEPAPARPPACRVVRVDPRRLGSAVTQLSGGNQQKLLFGRAIQGNWAGVLLMNEPTRGIDVGARAEIYQLMRSVGCRLCADHGVVRPGGSGRAVRHVVTMYRGRQVARYERGELNMSAILADITEPVSLPGRRMRDPSPAVPLSDPGLLRAPPRRPRASRSIPARSCSSPASPS